MIDFTSSPEFMDGLRRAVLIATADLDLAARKVDAENEWLTTKEAIAFLRVSESAWKRFKSAHPEKIRVSYALGNTEPRYQLAALQKLMREKSVGAGGNPIAGNRERDLQLSR